MTKTKYRPMWGRIVIVLIVAVCLIVGSAIGFGIGKLITKF